MSGGSVTPNIPDQLRLLINAHLPTMEHVDVLLALVEADPDFRSTDELSRQLRIESPVPQLKDLAGSGLVSIEAGPGGSEAYRYQPATAELRNAVDQLVEAHRKTPVSLIRAVYERPTGSAAQQFADAFRLRKRPS